MDVFVHMYCGIDDKFSLIVCVYIIIVTPIYMYMTA